MTNRRATAIVPIMSFVAGIGRRLVGRWKSAAYLAGVMATAAAMAVRRSYWTHPVRDVLARQVFFTGVEAVRFVAMVAGVVGIAVVLQAQVWLTRFGQSALVGPLLVTVVVRELGPLLTNFVVIGRSGTAIASELAGMRANREMRVLEAQGLDPFTYLVVPRVLGVTISVFSLTVVFLAVSFASGFLCGVLLGVQPPTPTMFMDGIMKAISPADVINVLAKTILPGMATGAICCIEGFSIEGAVTEVPQAAGRAVIRSVAVLFVISAVVSVLTYL